MLTSEFFAFWMWYTAYKSILIHSYVGHPFDRITASGGCILCIIDEFNVSFWQSVLGYEVREKGAPHNCLDDACAAMKLVLAVIERGCDTNILCLHGNVSFYTYYLSFCDVAITNLPFLIS